MTLPKLIGFPSYIVSYFSALVHTFCCFARPRHEEIHPNRYSRLLIVPLTPGLLPNSSFHTVNKNFSNTLFSRSFPCLKFSVSPLPRSPHGSCMLELVLGTLALLLLPAPWILASALLTNLFFFPSCFSASLKTVHFLLLLIFGSLC